MKKKTCLLLALAISLTGCNVVPPLDCVMGVQRPGCQRGANGMYHYLYTSPLLPAPNSDATPVGYPAPEAVVQPPAPPAPMIVLPPAAPVQRTHIVAVTPEVPQGAYPPPVQPMATYQQPPIAVTAGGTPMGVVAPMGGNNVVVSPDGQPIGVVQ